MRSLSLSVADHPACVSRARVYLDGGFVEHCVAAHEGEGWADVALLHGDGDLLERLTGKVEIRPADGVTREELERIADQLDMVHLAGFGPDGTVFVSSERLVCREAMALVRRLNALLPEVRVWVSAPDNDA